MATNTPEENNLYISQVLPVVASLLTSARKSDPLPQQAIDEITQRTLAAALHIRRVATKQRLRQTAFIERLTREQQHIWLAVNGTPSQQAKAMSTILAENQDTVRHFLKNFTFRTTDIAEDVLNESFSTFFEMINNRKPVLALMSTLVKGIARKKALKQLEKNQRNPWQWLETIYISAGDDEIGTFDYPMAANDEPETVVVTLPLTPETPSPGVPKRIEFDKAKRAIGDCLAQLQQPRQLLIRLVNTFWTGYEEGPLSEEQILSSYEKLSMAQIAGWTGYKDAHTASVRLTETNKMLRKCLDKKLNTTPLPR
ncbi:MULTISPECIES: hypothetical protein [unclassified Spirosoma]|uniref:hypothetical protein n=1 Tax=unclassified Spirosoma TaxID=2621999 RepID=UPI00095E20E1|nr:MULTISPECIES: hypothetical protein [unclassified Spirosoma]MBN8826622.1 hypothetical protein [Spirosoma sp.]OJW74460.1 MAG: hypothetical protein BGO59_20635 [Spirosoma sp. 48-14]